MTRSSRFVLLLAVVAASGAAAWHFTRPPAPPAPIAGMVRRTEIRIAPEVNGRLASIAAAPGSRVVRGDLLAVIDNPDLAAALGEAEAALASARADRAHVYAGVRPEDVAIAGEALSTADANLTLARQEQARIAALSARGFSSTAQLDETNAMLAKAGADRDGKAAALAAAKAGPTAEQRALADAAVAAAAAAVDDARAAFARTRLLAPVDGTVGLAVAETGEVITPGKPVLTLLPDNGLWFAFAIREDALAGLAIGGKVRLDVAGGKPVDGRVTELRPLGEWATWRAARAIGDHDLNSFRVRFDPTGPTDGLAAGMTVFYTPAPGS